MASSITPIPHTRAEWMPSGACTNGSTAHRKGVTRRASGGGVTTSTTRVERSRDCATVTAEREITTHEFRSSVRAKVSWSLSAALRSQRGVDDRLVHIHAGNGDDADAGRLLDVDTVDADARTDVAGRRGVIPRHVCCDDGGNDVAVPDPDVVALPPGRWRNRRGAPRPADRPRGSGLLLRLDGLRNYCFPAGRRNGADRDAASGAGARRPDRDLYGHPDRRRAPVHRVESARSCLLPGSARARACLARRRGHGLAIRPAPRIALWSILRKPDGNRHGRRNNGPARDGCRYGSHHPRTPRTGR